jgi:hypothetical protein
MLIRGTRNDPALPVRLMSKLLRSSIEAVREIASSLERGGASFGTSPGSMDILLPELLCTVPILVAGGSVCGPGVYLKTRERVPFIKKIERTFRFCGHEAERE